MSCAPIEVTDLLEERTPEPSKKTGDEQNFLCVIFASDIGIVFVEQDERN
jgi:hypothetical protein